MFLLFLLLPLPLPLPPFLSPSPSASLPPFPPWFGERGASCHVFGEEFIDFAETLLKLIWCSILTFFSADLVQIGWQSGGCQLTIKCAVVLVIPK